MGRGKLGGTKAKIRGKVGSEIYQLKRSADGALEQSVYKCPEQREYTNTEAQAKARMIMGQIERMFHILPEIITSAFYSINAGTLCFQHFAKLNYNNLKIDLITNWDGQPSFDWQPKYVLSAPAGEWILTDGLLPSFKWGQALFSLGVNNGLYMSWQSPSGSPVIADFLSACNMMEHDRLIVLFYIKPADGGEPYIEKIELKLNPAYNSRTKIEDTSTDDVFLHDTEWDILLQYAVSTDTIDLEISGGNLGFDYYAACVSFIIVREENDRVFFSSSSFRWLLDTSEYGYPRTNPATAFETWK